MTTAKSKTSTPEPAQRTLAELVRKLAALPDERDVPLSTTQRQLDKSRQDTAVLEGRISTINAALETLASLGSIEADTQWLDWLNAWRVLLIDELLQIKSPIKDKDIKARAEGMEWSIKLIDSGFGIAKLGIVTLAPTRIGELMAAAGYATSEPELRGPRGWRGSIKEVEHRVKVTTKRRADAQAALDDALLDDDARAKRDAEHATYRAALNGMDVRGGSDGLAAYTKDGDPLPVADMAPAQRKAFEWFEAAQRVGRR